MYDPLIFISLSGTILEINYKWMKQTFTDWLICLPELKSEIIVKQFCNHEPPL